MSRPPVAKVADPGAEKPRIAWFLAEKGVISNQAVLTTTDPANDQDGIPAIWYPRRQFVAGVWQKAFAWVDPMTRAKLEPQPTHWRPDPARGRLEVPAA
jgi:hypothetical protein